MVRHLERTGKLRAHKTARGVRFFERSEIERIAAERAQQRRGQGAGEMSTAIAATNLLQRDIEAPASRWVSPELAEQAGLFRVNSIDGAALVGRNGAGDYSGIAIPNVLPGQTEAREYRLRRDRPDLESRPDGSIREKGKYLHPPGRGNLLYFVPGTPEAWLEDTKLPVVVVEGEFKALALWRLAHHDADAPRWLPIGILGCWNWRGTVGKATGPDGERADVKGTISDLDRVAWDGRPVYLAPDTNVVDDPSVAAAWRGLAKELERRGAQTATVEVPPEPGINGIDDHLGRHGPEAGLALFEAAKPRNSAPARQTQTVAEMLEQAGLTQLKKGAPIEEVEQALRKLAASANGADPLRRAALRSAVIVGKNPR